MRERTDIEREMFEARQDLEESLDQLIHKAREKLEVRARAEHAVDENRTVLIVAALGIAAVVALFVALRVRRI
jgi:hypothetical protein